jgi:hypothetical protein
MDNKFRVKEDLKKLLLLALLVTSIPGISYKFTMYSSTVLHGSAHAIGISLN